jgi:hypothetical protein
MTCITCTAASFVCSYIVLTASATPHFHTGMLRTNRPALELLVLLAVYAKFTVFNNYFLETFSVYMLVVGWLFAPVMFNPNGLDSQAVIDDFEKWVSWMLSTVEVGHIPAA